MIRRPQKLYWRPTEIPLGALLMLAAAAIGALVIAENFIHEHSAAHYNRMLNASRTVQQGMDSLRAVRGRIEPINPDVDPLRSGMIGVASSPITTNAGNLKAKQSTINPNWAAVVIRLLDDAGVKPGDHVAVAVSGSFPVINLSVYAALEAMEVEPLVIVSGSASQWGANVPGFAWMDITRQLREAGVIQTRALAATLGAIEDRGIGLNDEGLQLIRQAAQQAGIPMLEPASYEAAVIERIEHYTQAANGQPIAAFINVGGGTATTGPPGVSHFFGSGLLRNAPSGAFRAPSVMGHFLQQNVPVINFTGMRSLAAQYGLPYPPEQMAGVGSGGAYHARTYRRWLAAVMILALLGLTALIMRSANIALAAGTSGRRSNAIRPKV